MSRIFFDKAYCARSSAVSSLASNKTCSSSTSACSRSSCLASHLSRYARRENLRIATTLSSVSSTVPRAESSAIWSGVSPASTTSFFVRASSRSRMRCTSASRSATSESSAAAARRAVTSACDSSGLAARVARFARSAAMREDASSSPSSAASSGSTPRFRAPPVDGADDRADRATSPSVFGSARGASSAFMSVAARWKSSSANVASETSTSERSVARWAALLARSASEATKPAVAVLENPRISCSRPPTQARNESDIGLGRR
mmetsp:Transcript_28906/g.99633  ORF Transcript_28906/g.99633 Transcript_28906/m.99633 type:complete len:263 (+) Transcript_28906:2397-3185(+)